MIISFSLTETELLAGKKTVTRRRWKPVTAARFTAGSIHQAWSALPFIPGARKLGLIRATQNAYQERLGSISAADLLAEGGMCATADAFCLLFDGDPDELIWVARFEVLSVVSCGCLFAQPFPCGKHKSLGKNCTCYCHKKLLTAHTAQI